MSTGSDTEGSVRLSFQLGPWRSPRSLGWRNAYEALVNNLNDAGLPIYGVLEAGLAGGRVGSIGWRKRFVANAVEAVARYASRIPTFEVLPGSNQRGPDGRPLLPEGVFARALADVYQGVKGERWGRPVTLVTGAAALYDDGAAYLVRMVEAGTKTPAWASVQNATGVGLPFDAIAAWLGLPDHPGPIPAGYLEEQVGALIQALSPFATVEAMPVCVPGLTWRMRRQGDYSGEDIEAALANLRRAYPQVRIAAREAAPAGPFFAIPGEAEHLPSLTFAVFSVPDFTVAFAPPETVPIIDGFEYPVGPRGETNQKRTGYAITTDLADPDYYANPLYGGAWHPGEDWAAYGKCDAGLSDPVYAIADGVVVCRQYFSKSWGRIILIRHTLRSGAPVWSQYAHLDSWLVEENEVVRRGQQVGTIGKGANNKFCAHLHFEIRNRELRPDEWFPLVRDKERVMASYLPPAQFIGAHSPGAFPDRRGAIVDNEPRQQESGTFARAETPGHWSRSYYGWNDTADFTYASVIETDWGEWRPHLPAAGRYEVQAWIPSRHATTRHAVYAIHHANGLTARAVDQAACNDQWVSLGTYDFGAEGALVRLTDKTGEPDKSRLEVCFDAIRWLLERSL